MIVIKMYFIVLILLILGDIKFNVTSASQGGAFCDVIVLRLILQILNNSPIPITVFPQLFVVVGTSQDLFEKGKYHACVLNYQI